MVEHIVLMKPKVGAGQSEIEALWRGLKSLQNDIQGITGIDCGLNCSPEQKTHGFELGFVVTFQSLAARNAYLPHPAHLAVVPLVRAIAEKVLVFDLEV